MPNAIAYLMLMLWPLICLVLFLRQPLERAIIWSILGGYLLLPPAAAFDLPLVPAMDKYSIPSLCAAGFCLVVARRRFRLLPLAPLGRVLVLLFLFGVIPTVLTNGDPMIFQEMTSAEPIAFITNYIPGMSLRDLVSVIANQGIVLLPFLLGRQFLSTETGLRAVLVALVLAGLAYSLPALLEVRLSPQLNIWIYGFFQHSFEQMMREGGFRPIVFLPHALWLAFFLFTAVLAAGALARGAEGPARARALAAMIYLALVLYLCKSLASQLYVLAFVPLILLVPARLVLRVCLACALVAVIYPVLRNTGLIPTEAIVAQAEAISPARAHSLNFRFQNEEILLARADEKPWFGWGGWGRNLVRDPVTGLIASVPDGRWIIVFGSFGWVGYIAEMGLLALPIALLSRAARRVGIAARPAAQSTGGQVSRREAARRRRFRPPPPAAAQSDPLPPAAAQSDPLPPSAATATAQIPMDAAAVALILAATMMDMLLNATLIPFTWLCAGAVLGHAERRLYPQGWTAPAAGAARRGPVLGRPRRARARRPVL